VNGIWNHRGVRRGIAGAAAVATAAALASAGLAGLRALDLGSAAAHQYPGKKVKVCHRTHSKKHPWVKIRVSRRALKAHLRHGDFVVDANHPCPPTSNSAKAKKNKHKKHKHGADAKKKHHGKPDKHHGKAGKGKGHGK
jgi:hypothetical protein